MAGLTDIEVGNFTKVYYDTTGTPKEVNEIQSITHPTDEKNIIEVAQFGQTYPRKLVGSSSTGNAEIVVNFDPSDTSHQYLLDSYKAGNRENFRIEINDSSGSNGQYYDFAGQVASKSTAGDFDSIVTVTFSLSVDGTIGDWTPKP